MMDTKPLAVGTILKGRYRIARLVAGGGMAWVYEVREALPDGGERTWAMKELRADAEDVHTLEEGRQLFAQEANILVRLSHPNLPRVTAYFEEGTRSYLVMEFIYGESLEKRLERARAPLLEAEVLDYATQICGVLTYLHTRPDPVIFRDMKPSNVMVTLAGQVKLIDFGIARTYKLGKRRDTVTMGSENYAAPEQWGKAQTDARADIYGLGAMMYHLLTNVPPLPAFVPTPRVSMQQYNPAIHDATAAVVDKAMAEDREQRYATAREMQEALLACMSRGQRRRMEALLAQHATAASAPRPAAAGSPPRGQRRQPTSGTAGGVSAGAAPRQAPVRASDGSRTAVPGDGDVKLCPRCGVDNRAPARFCRGCGHMFVAPPPPVLELVEPPRARWEYPLGAPSVLVGRRGGRMAVDLDLEFYDPEGYVSRNHARIEQRQRRFTITDVHSANGTFVNDERLAPDQPRALRQGDRIRMGRVVLAFKIR
jgi:hypothetical protein